MPARRRRLSIVLPDGDSHFALYVATCLGRRGHRVHVVACSPWSRIRFSRFSASFTAVPVEAGERAYLASVLEVAHHERADVVLPVSEVGTRFVRDHVAAFARTCAVARVTDAPTFATAGDKARFGEFLAANGLPHPVTHALPTDAEPNDAAPGLRFPVLFKPARASGGRGIVRFDTPFALHALKQGVREDGVLQEEIPGEDVDASVLCRDGEVIAATVQRGLAIGKNGWKPPTAVEFVDDAPALEVVRELMAALRWNGIANLDLRRDVRDGSVNVIELNPRYWSSLLGSCCAGVHFPELACLDALGEPLGEVAQRSCCYVQAATAVRAWMRGTPRFSLGETTIPAIAGDPLAIAWGRVERSIVSRAARKSMPAHEKSAVRAAA